MRLFFIGGIVLSLILNVSSLHACEFCTLAYIGRKEQLSDGRKSILTAKVFYENQDWNEIPAAEAHELHEAGHHTHDKQDEQMIHTMLTTHLGDRLRVDADIPYVTRHFIEIDSHAHLGENQTSQGLGDLMLTGDYRLIQDQEKSFGAILGVKLPTGATDEENDFDGLVEPELQPGTGSIDYLAGFAGSLHPGTLDLSASAVYVFKTEGEQDFRFGDVLSVSLFAGRKFIVKEKLQWTTGLMMNNQLEKKQNNAGGDIKDSGGYTMLIGPRISLGYDPVSFGLAYLAPAAQNLGGAHQDLAGIWTGSALIKF